MAATEDSKRNFVQKPEKPDQELFDKNLKIAQDEHAAAREKLLAVKSRLDFAKTPGKSPRQQELRDELSFIQAQQSAKKGDRTKIEEEMRTLETSFKSKIKDQHAAKAKLKYKTIEELDAGIKRMEADLEKGNMKVVDERRAVDEISSLKRARKNYAALDEVQKVIDVEKARFEELKQQRRDPEVLALSERYDAIKRELDAIKAEQDAAFQDLNQLRDERTRLQEEQQVKWQTIQTLRDEYFAAKDAYWLYEQEARRIKQEKWVKEQKEKKQAYKRDLAQRKMEEASEKAYSAEIITCEGLIGFFDPSSAEAARKAKLAAEPRALAAQPTRAIDNSQLTGTKLVKKDDREEDYFVGTGGKKKGKKGRKEPASSAAESASVESTGGKFNLNVGILEELAKIDVDTPMSRDDVPKTLEKLREKLAWYKENQAIKTKENIAKAQKEIDRLNAEDGEEPSGSSTPTKAAGSSTPTTTEHADPTEVTEYTTEAEEAKGEEKTE